MSTSTHLGQVGNRKELFQLAHQACDQSLQCRVELCSILNRKHFLQRQKKGRSIYFWGGGGRVIVLIYFLRIRKKTLNVSELLTITKYQ